MRRPIDTLLCLENIKPILCLTQTIGNPFPQPPLPHYNIVVGEGWSWKGVAYAQTD